MGWEKSEKYNLLQMIAIGMGVVGIGFAIAIIGYVITQHP